MDLDVPELPKNTEVTESSTENMEDSSITSSNVNDHSYSSLHIQYSATQDQSNISSSTESDQMNFKYWEQMYGIMKYLTSTTSTSASYCQSGVNDAISSSSLD